MSGILSAWGIGGGTLLLLIMTLFFHVEQQTAQGINLLFFLPTAFPALWIYRKKNFLHAPTIKLTAPWAALGAAIGAFTALYLESDILKKPFGLFLLLSGFSMLYSAFFKKKSA